MSKILQNKIQRLKEQIYSFKNTIYQSIYTKYTRKITIEKFSLNVVDPHDYLR